MNQERFLKLFLRVLGTVAGLAAFCVVMPHAWMDAIHRFLGMGVLPDTPIVGYLARSTSAFYALFGALLWVLSCDLARYRPLLRYVGGAAILLGILLFFVDRAEGMPLFWRAGEGPINVAVGAIILRLSLAGKEEPIVARE